MKNTIEEKNGIFTYLKNGQAAICPFRTPIVLPSQLQGQLQVMPHSCNSQCPHFNFNTKGELKLTCGFSIGITISDENNKDLIL